MSSNKLLTLILLLIIGLGAIVTVAMSFSYNNREIELRKKAEAQYGKVEGVYDKMWKDVTKKDFEKVNILLTQASSLKLCLYNMWYELHNKGIIE